MKTENGLDCWRRRDKIMRRLVKDRCLPAFTLVVVISIALLPSYSYAFGASNRRPPPPNQQPDRPLPPNNRPGPPPHQSIRRQGLPFDGPPPQTGNGNNNGPPPIGHRRMPNHPHGPPPHHTKHRGRPFPFPRRRPPPPPPRGRGPPPRDREREQDNNGRRPPHKQQPHHQNNNSPSETPPKLSFHIPPAPVTTPTPASMLNSDGFQQRPPGMSNLNGGESQNNFQQFQQNQFQQNQQQNQQHPFQSQQPQGQFPSIQNPQFPQQNNGNPNLNQFQNHQLNQFSNQHNQFPNNQQFDQNQQHQQQMKQHQQHNPQNSFQQGPSAMPPNFQPGPAAIPPTSFQPGLLTNPTQAFHNQLQGIQNGFPQMTNPLLPPHPSPSQIPPFGNNHHLNPFQQQQQQHQQHHPQQHQQPLFGQINPPSPSSMPHEHHPHNNNNPNNPPILEYAPPPNTFQQSTGRPDENLLQDKSKEIELNSIPKQTITFTVTPKPSKNGGTQLHFKISTPKPFKSSLKPLTNSKGYFKGSTYRPPVDKLNSKFKYSNTNSQSNPGYPDAEYRVQDGSRRESSMSAEMEPPSEHPAASIKDLILNRDHNLNQPPSPALDDTDNYAGPSYNSPPVYVKPFSGEEVLIAGVSSGKSQYHKGEHPDDDLPLRNPSGTPYDEDYDNGPINRNPFDEEELNSKSYADRHLPSYGTKDNHFDEFSNSKLNEDSSFNRRPSHSGSREEHYDEYEQERNNRPNPSIHIDEESLGGSGESGKRGNNRHNGGKFSQPDPLYHPEDDNGSGSRERARDNGGEFEDGGSSPARYDDFGSGGSAERRHKNKDYPHHHKDSQSKSTAEELLAALGLSTNPLVSMPDTKYPVDIPTKYSHPGSSSWEKDYEPENDQKRTNKNKSGGGGNGSGEPMGLLEYLSQKKDEETGQSGGSRNTEPLYSVPDRQIGGSAENSFVVKGSMKTTGGNAANNQETGKAPSNNVIVGRPIPQFQGTEQDLPKQSGPIPEQSSYVEQKVKGHQTFTSPTGQESYLYEKIHGSNPKNHPHHHTGTVPVINTGLYGPSVPPPISEPGTFTDSPPVLLSSASPGLLSVAAHAGHIPAALPHHPTILSQAPPAGSESYLYQKIHGDKPGNLATGLSFGPTPPSPHSVEDLSHGGLYNGHQHHHQTGLYASPSEQVSAASSLPGSTGLVYSNGKVSSQQQQQQGNGVLLPVGMGGAQQQLGPNSIQVNAPQQKLVNQQQHNMQQPILGQSQTQQQLLQPSGLPQRGQTQTLIANPTPHGPLPSSILMPQMPQQPIQQINQQQQSQLQQNLHQQQQQQLHQQAYNQAVQQQQQAQQQLYQTAASPAPTFSQQHVGQQSQNVPQIVPAPTSQQQLQQQQHGNLYGTGQESIDRIAQIPQFSAEMGLQHPQHQHQHPYQQNPYLQQQLHSQSPNAPQQPYGLQGYHPQQHSQFLQQHSSDPSVSASNIHHQQLHSQQRGDPYPVYLQEPDPIIEIIVQDSNMSLPQMHTYPPPPPQTPPTPEPVHVFYVKYSQKNNTPVFDNYYGQSNPQIQLEQPISSVPVRGPDRNGMLPVDDTPDSLPQSSIQQQNYFNAIYSTSTESTPSTSPTPGTTTTLRTIIRPDRNEFSQASSGLVVSFDNPAVERDIFANYTNALMQQQQQQHDANQAAHQQQHHQQQFEQQQQQQLQQQMQQQAHSYPEITFPPQQQYQQDPYAQQTQQQSYPSLDSLWSGLHNEQKPVDQQVQASYQGFNKRIGLQDLASLLEAGPSESPSQNEQTSSDHHHNAQQQQHQDYHVIQQHHQEQQQNYQQANDEQNPPPLYQYVESPSQVMAPHHQSNINTRQTKLPEDVPEELRNQLVQSGILGNADIQVINYSENLFKELGELPPEALAAFQAHTGDQNAGANKQLESDSSHPDQSVWSGSQVSIGNTDLSSLLPSGRSLRSVLVVKNSLRPKRGGRQRRVVLLITNQDDVLLYKPKDRSLKRIGDTSNPLIRRAIELSNHKMDDDETVEVANHHPNSRQSA